MTGVWRRRLPAGELDVLARTFPEARFLDLERDPYYVMQSLLEVRRRFRGDDTGWYSFKPPEYPRLAALSPHEQVAGQVLSIRRAIERQLAALPPERWTRITYRQLCERPAAVAARIDRLFPGDPPRWHPRALESGFDSADTERLAPAEAASLREAYRRLETSGF